MYVCSIPLCWTTGRPVNGRTDVLTSDFGVESHSTCAQPQMRSDSSYGHNTGPFVVSLSLLNYAVSWAGCVSGWATFLISAARSLSSCALNSAPHRTLSEMMYSQNSSAIPAPNEPYTSE